MILIDIEMPEKCGLCPCFHAEFPIYCKLIKPPDKDKRIVAPYGLPRPDWCPLKSKEAVGPKTIPEELKQKMWNALYAEEDKFEEKYVGTKEQDSWFLIYRPLLQEGFNLAIKAIADWEGRLSGND